MAEVKCKGDGTPGEIIYFDACNSVREIKNKDHDNYGKKIKILDNFRKNWLRKLFNKSSFITTKSGVDSNGIHSMEGTSLGAWTRDAIENVLDFELASLIGTIRGKIIED